MSKHLRYAKYVFRHKWFVFLAGLKLGVGWWQLITHDWSKFLPSEWGPYVDYFWGGYGRNQPASVKEAFDRAWNHHQKCQPHHWQHWILIPDQGSFGYAPATKVLPMPDKYVREMVADWHGAGRAQRRIKVSAETSADWMGAGRALGKPDTNAWYHKNRGQIVLHPHTRNRVEIYLDYPYWLECQEKAA